MGVDSRPSKLYRLISGDVERTGIEIETVRGNYQFLGFALSQASDSTPLFRPYIVFHADISRKHAAGRPNVAKDTTFDMDLAALRGERESLAALEVPDERYTLKFSLVFAHQEKPLDMIFSFDAPADAQVVGIYFFTMIQTPFSLTNPRDGPEVVRVLGADLELAVPLLPAKWL